MEGVEEDPFLPTWSTCSDGWAKNWSGTPTICTTTRILYHGRVFGAYLGFSVILIISVTDIQVGSVRPGRKNLCADREDWRWSEEGKICLLVQGLAPWKHPTFTSLYLYFAQTGQFQGLLVLGGALPTKILESLCWWPHLPGYCLCTDVFNLSLNLAIRSSWSEPQSAPSLVFADCIELLHIWLQRI